MVSSARKNQYPLVSVVVLNWNGIDDTIQCLESLKEVDYPSLEVIVVDNGSVESIEKLRTYKSLPIILIENKKNLGFTGGEITGFKRATGDFIVILNNDAVIEASAIDEMLSTLRKDPKIAAVGGRSYLLDENGKKMGIDHYTHQRVDPVSGEVETYMKDDGVAAEVSNVSGACIMLRRTAIEDCGYFDNNFFAYYEETDLFARFRRSGWKIVFNPKVIIWHKMGASTRNKKYMYNFLMLKNQFLFAYKNFDDEHLKYFKKIFRRHVRRSFLVYVKKIGRFSKDDIIHKARVDAYIHNLLRLSRYRKSRKNIQSLNTKFSINQCYFSDNPLPISMLVDASSISATQQKNLSYNLGKLSEAAVRINEIIVVSKKKIAVPATNTLTRIENIIDKKIFDMSPFDFYFMSSNNDLLLFTNAQILTSKLDDKDVANFQEHIKDIYTKWHLSEASGLVSTKEEHEPRLNLATLTKENFDIVALRKSSLTNHISEQTHIATVSSDTLTDVLGRALAQGVHVQTRLNYPTFLGTSRGTLDTSYEPILSKPTVWCIKQFLTDIHAWGILSKVSKRLLKPFLATPVAESETTPPPIVYSKDLPVIINTRDRFEPLVKLLSWLQHAGHDRILFVDNDSSYPPLLDLFEKSPYQVVRLGRNGMHKAPWESMGVRFASKDLPYIVSDPDVIPVKSCRKDALEYFASLLNKYPDIHKVGFGLKIDDIPNVFSQKQEVVRWESRYWSDELLLEKDIYRAPLDTTFALYRPHTWWFLEPSIRTGGDCTVQHEPWYQDSANPTDDFVYYKLRASRQVTTWGLDTLPKHHLRALKKEGFIEELLDEEDI